MIVSLLAVFGASASAAGDGVLDRLTDRYRDVPTLQASFVQTTRSTLYGEEVQKGTVALERPDKMRWVFEGDGRHFVTDGTTLWIWSPRDNQVLRIRDAGGELTAAQQVLQSLHRVPELFAVTVVSTDDSKGHVLSLAPRPIDLAGSPAGKPGDPVYFQTLLLTLGPALELEQVDLTDPQGTQVTLVFSGVALGADLPDDLFSFVAPAGADVVDAGGPL